MTLGKSWAITVLLAVLAVLWAHQAEAASRLDAETIKAALRTATAEENEFIDYVVELVDDGTLPRDLVEGTFQWARKKSRHKFQYFKHGLINRAAEIGIKL